MSEKAQKPSSKKEIFTELLIYSSKQSLWAIELLVMLSAYPFDHNEPFAPGDTLPLASPIRANSKLTSLLLLKPVPEHHGFQFIDITGKTVQILWALPITERERELIISGGSFAFVESISHEGLPSLLDLERDTLRT